MGARRGMSLNGRPGNQLPLPGDELVLGEGVSERLGCSLGWLRRFLQPGVTLASGLVTERESSVVQVPCEAKGG